MSDEDLIFLINSGSKLAEQVFYRRYSNFAHEVAKSYYLEFKDTGITEEDFYAVAFSKTHSALINYAHRHKNFLAYWRIVVKNAIYDYVRDNSYSLGARPLSGTSLDEYRYDNNEHLLFHDIYGDSSHNSQTLIHIIEDQVYGESNYLSHDEKLLADLLFFQELKPSEILSETNWSRNRLSYLMRVVKKKIQILLKENYYK